MEKRAEDAVVRLLQGEPLLTQESRLRASVSAPEQSANTPAGRAVGGGKASTEDPENNQSNRVFGLEHLWFVLNQRRELLLGPGVALIFPSISAFIMYPQPMSITLSFE